MRLSIRCHNDSGSTTLEEIKRYVASEEKDFDPERIFPSEDHGRIFPSEDHGVDWRIRNWGCASLSGDIDRTTEPTLLRYHLYASRAPIGLLMNLSHKFGEAEMFLEVGLDTITFRSGEYLYEIDEDDEDYEEDEDGPLEFEDLPYDERTAT